MASDIRDLPAPPEAQAIKLARMAARMSVDDAVAAVRQAGGTISTKYWRDLERGHGGRRGARVTARASDGLLAQMADAVGVTPDQLREAAAGHPDGEKRAQVVRNAARVLEEIQRIQVQEDRDALDAQVITLPVGADDLIRKVLAVQRILGGPIDPDDVAENELLRLPLSAEGSAAEILKLRKIRAGHSPGNFGTGRQRR